MSSDESVCRTMVHQILPLQLLVLVYLFWLCIVDSHISYLPYFVLYFILIHLLKIHVYFVCYSVIEHAYILVSEVSDVSEVVDLHIGHISVSSLSDCRTHKHH